MLRKHAECDLSFAPKGKSLLANKGTKSQSLHHPFLILFIPLVISPSVVPIVSPRYVNLSTISKDWPFYAWTILCHVSFLISTFVTFKVAILIQFTSDTTSLMHPTPAKM